jgi:hypothetical protein
MGSYQKQRKIGGNKEKEEKGRRGGEEDENHTSSPEMQSRMKNVFRAFLSKQEGEAPGAKYFFPKPF